MISFAELSNTWSNTVLCGYKYTYQIEVNCALKHLNNYFGARDCEKIKGLDVEKFLVFESEIVNPNTGKPFSKRVLNDHVDVGNTIYEFGLDNDIIHCRNPFQRKRKKIPKSATANERVPIDDTQKQYILNVYHRSQIAALIMLFCGLRRGEIIPLEWNDIDFVTKQIAVTKSAERVDANHFVVKAHTKNGKDRYVSIPDMLLTFLKLEKYNANGGKYVFPQTNGNMHTISSWKSTWNSYQKQLNYRYYCDCMRKTGKEPKGFSSPSGIPNLLDKFTAHQLRHTYCTMLYFAGVDILTASKLMGHSNVRITLEIYTHLDERYKQLNIDKYNQYIANNKQTLNISNCLS